MKATEERWERCLWQMKRPERVTEVNKIEESSETEADKKGFVCKICGWVYEGEELPEDIVCPLCKHGAADFEPLA